METQAVSLLSPTEEQIYRRQIMMEGWGLDAQERLKNATVFVAGAGGLGSPAAIYLTVAGVGNLRICDFDSPEWTNLNRQILHDASRIGVNKAYSAMRTLERLNGFVHVDNRSQKITSESVDELITGCDLILDCMDNFETRYILNDFSLRRGIPMIYASIRGLEGRLSFLSPPETPCLQCIVREAPPKEVFPVVGAVPGVIGTLQALEAIKYLTGIGSLLKGKLLLWDGEFCSFQTLTVRRDPSCPACSSKIRRSGDGPRYFGIGLTK